ncbi:MAG TPA: hypothetical protein VGM83_17260 [Devosiaceae bacterium]|jgi:hypothetical protein
MEKRVTIRVDGAILDAIERFRNEETPNCKTRQDVVRLICRDWLIAHGYLEHQQEWEEDKR